MPSTYTPIATTTLGSSASSVTLSSISAAYTDLRLIINATSSTAAGLNWSFNGDTSTNYSGTVVYGDGSAAYSTRKTNDRSLGSIRGTDPSMIKVEIQNYSNTTTYKIWLFRQDCASVATQAWVCLWRATPAAINSIAFTLDGGATFSTGSTFTLYGVKSA